jgi:hypothetical protein
MKRLIPLLALLSLCLAVAPVTALDVHHGLTYTLTAEDEAMCEAEGGCHFVSKVKMIEAIEAEVKRRVGNCMGTATWKPA